MQPYDQKKVGLIAGAVLVLAIVIVAFVGMANKAKAQAGCGFGAQTGFVADTNALAGGSVFCDAKSGIFVVGVFADYNWALSDLSKAGLDKELALGGRAGIMVNPSTTVGGLLAWSQLSGGGDHIDGYKYGPYLQFKFSDAPGLYGGVDITRNDYDGDKTYQVMLRAMYKFEPKQTPLIAPYLDNDASVPAPKQTGVKTRN